MARSRITMDSLVSLRTIAETDARAAIVADVNARRWPCAVGGFAPDGTALPGEVAGISCAARVKSEDRALRHGIDGGHEFVAAPTFARRTTRRAAYATVRAELNVKERYGIKD